MKASLLIGLLAVSVAGLFGFRSHQKDQEISLLTREIEKQKVDHGRYVDSVRKWKIKAEAHVGSLISAKEGDIKDLRTQVEQLKASERNRSDEYFKDLKERRMIGPMPSSEDRIADSLHEIEGILYRDSLNRR